MRRICMPCGCGSAHSPGEPEARGGGPSGEASDSNSRHASGSDAERAQHAAEISNQPKREFLSILGHELRNPLNAIVKAARVLGPCHSTNSMRSTPPCFFVLRSARSGLCFVGVPRKAAQAEPVRLSLSSGRIAR
jgi:hypothetical protein